MSRYCVQRIPSDEEPDSCAIGASGKSPKDLAAERSELLAMCKKLIGHCNNGAWAGAERRANIARDLDEAEAIVAKAEGRK